MFKLIITIVFLIAWIPTSYSFIHAIRRRRKLSYNFDEEMKLKPLTKIQITRVITLIIVFPLVFFLLLLIISE